MRAVLRTARKTFMFLCWVVVTAYVIKQFNDAEGIWTVAWGLALLVVAGNVCLGAVTIGIRWSTQQYEHQRMLGAIAYFEMIHERQPTDEERRQIFIAVSTSPMPELADGNQ